MCRWNWRERRAARPTRIDLKHLLLRWCDWGRSVAVGTVRRIPQSGAEAGVVGLFKVILDGDPLDAHSGGADDGAGAGVVSPGGGIGVLGASRTVSHGDSFRGEVGGIVKNIGAAGPELIQFPHDD